MSGSTRASFCNWLLLLVNYHTLPLSRMLFRPCPDPLGLARSPTFQLLCLMLIAHSFPLLWSVCLSRCSPLSSRYLGGHSLLPPTLKVAHNQWLTNAGIQKTYFTGWQLCGTIYTSEFHIDQAPARLQLKPCFNLATYPASHTFLQVSLETTPSIKEVCKNTCFRLWL